MLEVYHNIHEQAYKALEINKLIGNYTTEYISKCTDIMHKDKVAASFISSETFEIMCQYENTVINIKEQSGLYTDTLMSNKKISYIGIISIIYAMRLYSLEVSAIANISYKNDYNILSVENLGSNAELVKLTFPEFLKSYFSYIINESRIHKKDKFIICKLDNSIKKLTDKIIYTGIMNSYNIVDTYTLISKCRELFVIETRTACFVIYNNSLVVVSKTIKEETEPLQEYLNSIDSTIKLDFISSILML